MYRTFCPRIVFVIVVLVFRINNDFLQTLVNDLILCHSGEFYAKGITQRVSDLNIDLLSYTAI